MLVYKDITFCSFYNTCKKGDKCDRALNHTVLDGAEKTGLMISQFVLKPGCYEGRGKR